MKTMMHIKTDKDLKTSAQDAAEELGISLSTVVNASLRNFVRTREVHISAVPRMTKEFEELLGPIEKDIREGKNLSPVFSSAQEMDEYLDTL